MRLRAIFTSLLLCTASHGEDKTPPLLRYDWSGGFSPLASTKSRISNKGEVEVTVTPRQGAAYSYHTTLSETELEQLNALLDSCEVFKNPAAPDDRPRRPETGDAGITELEANRAGSRRSLTFVHEPTLEPLAQHIYRLVFQAIAVHSIETDSEFYSATSGLGKLPSPVLQPNRLKEPLAKYIATTQDRQRLEWALTGLAQISTAEEFAGTVSDGLKKEKRTDLLSSAIPGAGNIPDSHEAALCPVYLEFLKTYDTRTGLSPEKKYALEAFSSRLGDRRYKEAIPFFITRIERSGVGKPPTGTLLPLARMGVEGLRPLVPFLSSEDETRRRQAIEVLAIAARLNPAKHHPQSYSEEEFAPMRPIFKDEVLPRLSAMAESDPSRAAKWLAAKEGPNIAADIAE